MKVLVVTTLYPNPEEPGKATFLRDRVCAVAAQPDVEVEVVAPVPYFPRVFARWAPPRWAKFARVPEVETRDGLRVHHPRYLVTPRVGMRHYGRWLERGAGRCVARIAERFAFDLVDGHYLYPDAWAAVRIARRFGVPAVVSARGTDTHTYGELPAIRPKIAEAVRGAAAVITVSADLARRVGEIAPGVEPTVIPNGVDTVRFDRIPKAEARARLGLEPDRTWFVTVGRLTPVKGHEVLLAGIGRLFEGREAVDRSRVGLVIVGDGELRSELENLVGRLGLDGVVRFAGACSQDALPLWYSAADRTCLASHREGWPNVLMESLACGTPVLASRVGGAPEILSEPCLGRLVAPGDVDEWTDALADVVRRCASGDDDTDPVRVRSWALERSWASTAERVVRVMRRAS